MHRVGRSPLICEARRRTSSSSDQLLAILPEAWWTRQREAGFPRA
jgi:hypothetical protein